MGTALLAAVFALLGVVPASLPASGQVVAPAPPPVVRDTGGLQLEVAQIVAASGAQIGVSLIELGGAAPVAWSYNGDQEFVAASTYKLPLLMAEAQMVAGGAARNSDLVCYDDSMYEDGYYNDYSDGECFTRQELAARVGQMSDNTAAHMLVASLGGTDALNSYGRQHGAVNSAFYDPNLTTAGDLARLWVNEATGRAGGGAAQQWLYPLLTHTAYEAGIPAGVQATATVVHKVGMLDSVDNDAALVLNGPHGAYVLVVMTDGPGGDAGWGLISEVSSIVWRFEIS